MTAIRLATMVGMAALVGIGLALADWAGWYYL